MELFERAARIATEGTCIACLSGIQISLAVLIFALQVWPQPLSGAPAYLASGIFWALPFVALAFLLCYLHNTQVAPPRQSELTHFGGCPRLLRGVCYGLMLLGVGIFTGSVAFELVRPTGPGGEFAMRVATFGLFSFSFMFAQLYSVRELARRSLARSPRKQMHRLVW